MGYKYISFEKLLTKPWSMVISSSEVSLYQKHQKLYKDEIEYQMQKGTSSGERQF